MNSLQALWYKNSVLEISLKNRKEIYMFSVMNLSFGLIKETVEAGKNIGNAVLDTAGKVAAGAGNVAGEVMKGAGGVIQGTGETISHIPERVGNAWNAMTGK